MSVRSTGLCPWSISAAGMDMERLMQFSPDERAALFLDGSNLFSAARALDLDIDYQKLRQYFERQVNVIRALYYTPLPENQDYSPVRPLVDWLDYNGYTVVTKPIKAFADAQGRTKLKGNMEVDLAVDAMQMLPQLDHLILFSGDGNFRRLAEAAQWSCCRVTVVSTLKSEPPLIADELRRQADQFIDLADMSRDIRRTGQRQHPLLMGADPIDAQTSN